MPDYSTWKVTDLKAELKRRGIPQTGLRVKQQIIDRLVEEDAKGQDGNANEASTTAEQGPQEESQPAETDKSAKADTADNERNAQDAAHSTADFQAEQKKAEKSPVENIAVAAPLQPDRSTDHPSRVANTETPSKEAQEPQEKDSSTEVGDNKSAVEATAEKVEQAPGGVAQTEPAGISLEDSKPSEAAEKLAPSVTEPSGVNTGLSTPLPKEELIEDVRKRKRRSQSPAPNLEEVAKKRAKALEDEPQQASREKDKTDTDGGPRHEVSVPISQILSHPAPHETLSAEKAGRHEEMQPGRDIPAKQDMRFKGLFTSAGREQTRPASPPADTEMEDVQVEPALHAATPALYIDGLMRPLQPAALKNHLISVASLPGSSPNPDLIVDFYLDSIKTHCFVKFIDISTASRARSSLHGATWPNERNRKSLFVDFIPEYKLHEWVQREEESRERSGPPPRWEVKYDRSDKGVEAVLGEVDNRNAGTHESRGPAPKEFTHPPPRGPRADMQGKDRRPSGPSQARRASQPGQGFKPLDEIFKSTTAKPKLYYLPVPRDIADRRLDRFDDLLRKGSFPRRGGDETRRISFEHGDQFIDVGPEFGSRGRGGGGGRGRGRGRGGGMAESRRDSRKDRS